MNKQELIKELVIEVMACGTNDIKTLQQTIEHCMYNYNVTKMKETLPSTGDGSTTKYLFEQFTKDKYAQGLSKSTMKKYLTSVQKLFSFIHKEVNLATKDDIVNYLAFYRSGGENYQNDYKLIGDNAVTNRFRDLSSFYSWMYDNRYIAENPMTQIKAPKTKIPHKDIIVSSDLEKMIISCENHYKKYPLKLARNTAIILLLIETGVRNSELCNIKLGDIDFKNNKIIISHGKGNKKRKVYFGDRTKERLYNYLRLRNDLKNDDYLFIHYYKDKQLSSSGVENIIKQIGVMSGLPKLYPHLFRASFATKLIDNGVSPMVVKELMGHSKLDTLNNYVEMTDEMITNAIRIAFD